MALESYAHVLIISTPYIQSCEKEKKQYPAHIFCYVHFSKTFDFVHHSLPFARLLSIGVTGKMYTVMKCMYKNLKSCVKIDDMATGHRRQEDIAVNPYKKASVRHVQMEKSRIKCTFFCCVQPTTRRDTQWLIQLKTNLTFIQKNVTWMTCLKYC